MASTTESQDEAASAVPVRPARKRRTVAIVAGWGALTAGLVAAYTTMADLPAEVLYQVAVWASLGVLVAGIRRFNRSSAWAAIVGGYACFAIGDLLFSVYDATFEEVPTPSWADVSYLAGYPLIVAGLLVMIRRRQPRGDRSALLDAGVVGVSFAVLTWVNLIQPLAGGPGLDLVSRLIVGAYPVGDLMILAVLVRLVFCQGGLLRNIPRALVTLIATTVVMLVADVAYLVADFHGTYTARGWIDALYLVSYIGLAMVGTDPSLRNVTKPVTVERRELSQRRLWLLVIAVLLTPAVVAVEALHGRPVPALVIVLGTGVAVILVALRTAGLLKSLEASRDALTHESTHDSLTGIANRTLFSRRLTDVLTEGRRCSVVLVDLDGFKAVNDELGHLVGDALLIEAANRLTRAVRAGDLVARFGGDEFAVLLPDSTPEVAKRVTDRVAELLNADVVVRGHEIPLRASVGLANWDASSAGLLDTASDDVAEVDGVDRLLAAADRAMYQAKRQRARHLVLVSTAGPPEHLAGPARAPDVERAEEARGGSEPAAVAVGGRDRRPHSDRPWIA